MSIGAGSATDAGFAWTLPTEVENLIVLSAGIPDPDSLPVQDLREAFDRVLTESGDQALRYGGVLGYEGLRRALAERHNSLEANRSGPENFLIGNTVEDSAYADIYFDVPPPPSIYALAGGQGVVQVGSFSKILATGLRMGWVRGRSDFIDALARVRFDMGNSPLLQRALGAYLESGKLDQHLARVRALYARKCEMLSQSLRRYCSQYFNFERPDGGFYLWIDCIGPEARDVRREASKVGVVFPLGSTFFLDQERDDATHLRLAFSTASLAELEKVGPLLKVACDRAVGER